MEEPREGYGYGIIRLDRHSAKRIAPQLKAEDTDTQGQLKARGLFEEVRKCLLLPETYTIQGVWVDPYSLGWTLLVEAPGVPEVEEGARFPELVPTYQRTYHEETGAHVTILLRIEMENGPEKKVIYERQEGASA